MKWKENFGLNRFVLAVGESCSTDFLFMFCLEAFCFVYVAGIIFIR